MIMKHEVKIIGINPFLISALLTIAFLIVCATGGENVNWGYLGFEVVFPFYMAMKSFSVFSMVHISLGKSSPLTSKLQRRPGAAPKR